MQFHNILAKPDHHSDRPGQNCVIGAHIIQYFVYGTYQRREGEVQVVEAGPSSPAVDQVEGAGLEPCYEPLHDGGNIVHDNIVMTYMCMSCYGISCYGNKTYIYMHMYLV